MHFEKEFRPEDLAKINQLMQDIRDGKITDLP